MHRTIDTSPFPRAPENLPEDIRVVTPHRPAAEALRSPRVSLQTLARRILARNGIGVAEPRIAARELRAAVAEVLPRIDPSAGARRVGPMLRTILRVGIDTDELKVHGSRRAAELAGVAEIFRQRLRELGLVDSAAIVWEAANLPDIGPEPLLIYGYPRARKEEVAFINRLAGDGSVYHLPVAEGSDAFKSNLEYALQMQGWGWALRQATGGDEAAAVGETAAARFVGLGHEKMGAIRAHSLQDVGLETRFVLGEVKKLLRAGTPAGEIAIAVRDLNLYAKEFAIVGAEYGVPTVSSLRIPLSETLVGGLVERLLAAVEKDFDFEEAVRLLGHPFGPGMCDETWKRSRRERTATYEKWRTLEESLGCLDAIRTGEGKPMSGWVDCFRSILKTFEVRGRAGHRAREIVAFNRLQEELAFAAAGEEGEIPFREFASAVRDILGNVKTPFDPARLGVLVTEPDTLVGGRFRHVFVMGMAEGILPARPVENAVIDFHERSLLAKKGFEFEEAADIPRWEALSFFSLLSTATESLTLTYPRSTGKEGKIKSSFFARLGVEPTPAQPSVLSSDGELIRNTLRKNAVPPAALLHDAASQRLKVERTRESADRHDEFDGVIGEAIDLAGRKWSVSQLKSLAGCGFKWFANYGLGVKPADEMELEVTDAAKGKLFHFALDHAVSKGGARTPEEIADQLAAALEAGYRDADVAMPALRNWGLIKAEYLAALTRAVKAVDFLRDGCEIAATEKEFTVDLHGLKVRGRIDRVDRTPGGLVAVDYKSGKDKPKPAKDRDGRKLDLQLAVYLAAMKMLYPGENVAGGVYYSLAACKTHKGSAAEDGLLREFLAAVVEAPRTGSLAVRPISKDTCTYCDYDHLCRKGARLLRKEAAAR